MFNAATFFEVLPLRAIIFQFLFLLVAIAVETVILDRYLEVGYKISVQYAATINLLSTFLGWVIFFNVLPYLPSELKTQLLSFVFFEQFFDNVWIIGVFPILITVSLGIFLGTFIVKAKGLDLLEWVLDRREQPLENPEKSVRFQREFDQAAKLRSNNQIYAVFVANAWSFSAILFLLFVRFVEQTYLSANL